MNKCYLKREQERLVFQHNHFSGVNNTLPVRFQDKCLSWYILVQLGTCLGSQVEEMEDEAEDLETAGNGSEPKDEDQAFVKLSD